MDNTCYSKDYVSYQTVLMLPRSDIISMGIEDHPSVFFLWVCGRDECSRADYSGEGGVICPSHCYDCSQQQQIHTVNTKRLSPYNTPHTYSSHTSTGLHLPHLHWVYTSHTFTGSTPSCTPLGHTSHTHTHLHWVYTFLTSTGSTPPYTPLGPHLPLLYWVHTHTHIHRHPHLTPYLHCVYTCMVISHRSKYVPVHARS